MADQTNQKKDMDKIVKYTVKPLITNTSEEFIKFYTIFRKFPYLRK